jgi:8-oxo-dGTP pyrophosphatase MutT (NUDIX family)
VKPISKSILAKLPQFSEAAFFPDEPDRLDWEQSVKLFLGSKDNAGESLQVRGLAAILFLFMWDYQKAKWKVVLTKRSPNMPSHKGQIGFAGGHREEAEAFPEETAVREAEEELGVEAARVKILGRVKSVWSIDQKMIVPVIACLDADPNTIQFDSREIEKLMICEVRDLFVSRVDEFEFILFGKKRHSWLFRCNGEEVWGLTAKIIKLAGLRL